MKNFLQTCGSNPKIGGGKLQMNFQKPWNHLAETAEPRLRGEGAAAENALWWTMGESNSRTSDANRVHYHYANGPSFKKSLFLGIGLYSAAGKHIKQPQDA